MVTVESTEKQLDRVLSFFARVDAKANALFAINSGLLAVMGTRVRAPHLDEWLIFLPAIVATIAIVVSLIYLYMGAYPQLKGGAGSLVYFGEIANRTESQFSKDYKAATSEERLDDLICQIWRNSEILKMKFHAVRWAFIWTATALIPWCWFLAASSWGQA